MANETYRLKSPIEYGDQTIETLTIREMELGDLEEWDMGSLDKLPMKDLIALIGNLTGQPPSVARKIKMVDLKPLFEILKKGFPAGQ